MANVFANTLTKKNHTDSTKNVYETDTINMLEFLIDNIFDIYLLDVFSTDSRHSYWYQMCSFYSHGTDFIHEDSQEKRKETTRSFNFHSAI
jgi:hypothetical protein